MDWSANCREGLLPISAVYSISLIIIPLKYLIFLITQIYWELPDTCDRSCPLRYIPKILLAIIIPIFDSVYHQVKFFKSKSLSRKYSVMFQVALWLNDMGELFSSLKCFLQNENIFRAKRETLSQFTIAETFIIW